MRADAAARGPARKPRDRRVVPAQPAPAIGRAAITGAPEARAARDRLRAAAPRGSRNARASLTEPSRCGEVPIRPGIFPLPKREGEPCLVPRAKAPVVLEGG